MAKKTDETKIETTEEKAQLTDRQLLLLLARAFNIPPEGIVLAKEFSNRPYLNMVGLQAARNNYADRVVILDVGLLNSHEKPGDTAMAVVKGKYTIPVANSSEKITDTMMEVGTAGASNMNTIRDYPNELAITRAINRFYRRALLPLIYEDFYTNLNDPKVFSDEERETLNAYLESIGGFGNATIEEMNSPNSGDDSPAEAFLTNEEVTQIKDFLTRATSVETQEELDKFQADIVAVKDNLNDKQKQKLREVLRSIRKDKGLL